VPRRPGAARRDDAGLSVRGAILAAALLAALAASARADEIVLKSGRVVAGVILEVDERRVKIEVEGGATSIPRDQIETIRRGKAPVDPPPADAPKTPSPVPDAAAPSSTPRALLAALDAVRLEPSTSSPSRSASRRGPPRRSRRR
jgi:hypothetical protein